MVSLENLTLWFSTIRIQAEDGWMPKDFNPNYITIRKRGGYNWEVVAIKKVKWFSTIEVELFDTGTRNSAVDYAKQKAIQYGCDFRDEKGKLQPPCFT